MLILQDVESYYGNAQALFGVSFTIEPGEVMALMGRNGMGKSSTIRAIMGLTPARRGSIHYNNSAIHHKAPYEVARRGIGLVPEGRQIFPSLTVRENLLAVASNYCKSDNPYTLSRIFSIFPRLEERLSHRGRELSGGEQQMLAIARALMINPSLLLLDEATEGLAPMVCDEIWSGLQILKKRGLSILVVDKNINSLLGISDRLCIMEKGRMVWSANAPFDSLNHEIKLRYLGV